MAGDWIKFELATLDKPEVCQIADMADIDVDAVVGKLLRVWGWFDQQTQNGNAPSVTKKLLNRMVGVTNFCECMVKVGWMLDDGETITLPNFGRHNGKTAKNRALTAKRVASHKVCTSSAIAKGNAESVSDSIEPALPKEEKILNPTHTPGASNRVPVQMHLEWLPPENLLAAYATRSGVPRDLFTPEAIGPFVIYHHARGTTKPDVEHVAALVAWVKQDQARNARVVPLRAGQQGSVDDSDTGWLENLT